MSKIPFCDLLPQYEELKTEIDSAIADVIKTSSFIQGKPVAEFEKALAESVGVKHACGVANATSALWITLKALGIGPGDEVITTVHTAIPTAESITLNGAKVVFADIDPKTYQINPEHVETLITSRTRALLPVHLYGIPFNMPRMQAISKTHNLPLIEDCAQAQGAEISGKRVGSMGIAGCYSFFPSKNLGTMGDGGAMATNDDKIEKFVRMFSNHGRLEKFTHEIPGSNERLDALHAAILKVKLTKLDEWNAKRRKIADVYKKLLPEIIEVTIPQVYPDTVPVWHLYVIRCPNRDGLMKYLKEKNIGTGLHYPLPLHLQPAMAQDCKSGDFPEAEKATKEIVSIPMYPHMTEEQAAEVCAEIKNFFAKK
ncbi:MAG: DegT/DnrJ/EryC1/StrS family aminotransferase [bacterium]|nr:DegT/DnrJ/EryC1/StrS family aminotransferase [Candidatus Sumerlaeota bacterium]